MAEATQMEAQNQNAYILRDVFDARMDRMEMLLEKTLLEMKSDNERLRNEMDQKFTGLRNDVKQEIGGLRNEMDQKFAGFRNDVNQEIGGLRAEVRVLGTRMDGLDSRIDGVRVQTTVYWGFAIVAIVIAFLPTIQDWRKAFRRPSFSLEDVQQRIDAAIAKALKPEALS